MTTPDQRARDKDRDAAIEMVEAAWADGQIVEADRDKRVEELQRAQTMAEIQLLTQGLEPPMPGPAVGYGPPTPPAYPTLDQVAAASPRKVSKPLLVVPLIVVAVIVVSVIGGIVALVGTVDDAGGGFGGLGGDGPVDVLSADGYADLLAAVVDETGGTVAFSAVLYPTYAVVELPVDATTLREEYWYWDGHDLTRNDVKSTSSWPRLDLGTVDPAVFVDLIEQVKGNVEDPTSWYAIVRAPDDDRAVVWAYASNEYSESEYLGARRDGTITYDSTAS